MELFVDVFEVGVGNMRVNLGGTDIAVAEHALHTTDVGTIHQKVGGKAVAHGVRADVFGDAREFGIFADHALILRAVRRAVITTG